MRTLGFALNGAEKRPNKLNALSRDKKGLKKHKRDAKSRDFTCGVAQDKEVNNGRFEVFSRWSE